MPIEIKFDGIPAGYALNAGRGGENVQCSTREFVSSEDGDKLVSRLEGVSDWILSRIPIHVSASTIDHLLAIIRPDKTGTVYINELEFEGLIRPRGSLKKGDPIFKRDILDVERIKIRNATIPREAGFIMVLSSGWRKGLYYDLVPLHAPGRPARDYDVELLLGQFWAYLMFQDLLKIDEPAWQELFRQRWFPFIYLGHPLLRKIIEHAKIGWDVDELLPKIRTELDAVLRDATGVWRNNLYFQSHVNLIERAIERYHADDHVSVAAILYPRIEGVMRSYFASAGIAKKRTYQNLTREVIQKDADKRHSCCLFLPRKFRDYLDKVCFAHFRPGSAPDVGRHSVAHGEARAEDFGPKSSLIGFLTLYQLALFLTPDSQKKEEADRAERPGENGS